MKIIKSLTYYAPSLLNFSHDLRGKKTGDLRATIFTRTFRLIEQRNGKRHIDATRGFEFVRWDKDSDHTMRVAVAAAVKDLKELKGLDENPPLYFIPDAVERALNKKV
jgi:hypothetical protein